MWCNGGAQLSLAWLREGTKEMERWSGENPGSREARSEKLPEAGRERAAPAAWRVSHSLVLGWPAGIDLHGLD